MVRGYSPKTFKEALVIKNDFPEVVPYAGGTDLMVENRKGISYLFLSKIPEIKIIYKDDEYIHIGSTVTFTEAIESPLVPAIMKDALVKIAAPAIRNAGTFGGNLGNGSAKADSVLIEFVTDAKIVLSSVEGDRVVPVSDFYLGRKKLDLMSNELIKEILLPSSGLDDYMYEKVGGRNALAISRVSFCGLVKFDGDRIVSIAAAFGAVADTVLRFREIEAKLIGRTKAEAKAMHDEILSDYSSRLRLTRGRVSAEYRKEVCLKLLSQFLTDKGL